MSEDFTYKKGDLLLPGPNFQLNACVGHNGGPRSYMDYARGYFHAARSLTDDVLEGNGVVDILIYPTIYLYRHAFELAMKGLIRELKILEGSNQDFPKNHKLLDLWNVLEKAMHPLRTEFDGGANLLTTMQSLIGDLELLDASAEVFRFPESKNGQMHLSDRSLINFSRLEPLTKAENVFEYWNDVISEHHDLMFNSQ